jgi:putative ABC transport system permease protein
MLLLVLVAVGLVMLIVCADIGGLLLSRAMQRRKEITIRASLGAGIWRIARSLVLESLTLTIAGGMAGTVLAWLLVQLLTAQLALLPIALPRLQSAALDGRALTFNLLLCVVVALLCSVPPVLIAARADLQSMLRGGGSVPTLGFRPSRVFASLIALQTGFAFLLLVGSGLILHSLFRLQGADHGIQPDHVLTLRVPVGTLSQPRPNGKYNTRPQQMAYYREILERVRTVPGVRSAAVVNNPPLSDIRSSLMFRLDLDEAGKPEIVSSRTVSPQYFASMGIPILAGRDFTDADQTGAPDVAIINEFLAQRLFAGRNPLGERLRGESTDRPGPEVVGVVRNAPQMSYEAPPGPEVYIPYQQFIFATFMSTVVVRTEPGVDLSSMGTAIRKQVWTVDPNQPIVKVQSMNEVIERAIWRPRLSAWIFSILSGFAVLLTALGVYGIVAYTATLRKQEVGIRIALGATPGNVGWEILRGVLTPLLAGLGVSAVAAVFLSQLLAGLLYEIRVTDPLTYVVSALVIVGFGVAASLRPTWQAATQDPLLTLRGE